MAERRICSELVARTEERRIQAASQADQHVRRRLGQFFTPAPVAEFIAHLPRTPARQSVEILDPGAGVGSLLTSAVARLLEEFPGSNLRVTAVEIDPSLQPFLAATLADCEQVARSCGNDFTAEVVTTDFLTWGCNLAVGTLFREAISGYDLAVMNPPYKKIGQRSHEKSALASLGVDVTNLYAAFLAVSAALLREGGQLAAITPRSFANGPYFRDFRRYFLNLMAIDRLHLFDARNTVFADADVLQENIIFSATRSAEQSRRHSVIVSSSHGDTNITTSRSMPYDSIVLPNDQARFVRITTEEADVSVAQAMASLPATLGTLRLSVSTGRVVDFRAPRYLRADPDPSTIPLIYPGHLHNGSIEWPIPGYKKPNALLDVPETQKLQLPSGVYVLVKRFTSKEERRRVVAAVFDPEDFACSGIGFENHLNVYHCGNRGISRKLAAGLCLWLNSSAVDRYFRQFNGHTQVNATDLRSLRYPDASQLERLGSIWGRGDWPDQSKIDDLVELHVLGALAGCDS